MKIHILTLTFILAPFLSANAFAAGQCSDFETTGRSQSFKKISVTRVKVEMSVNDRGIRERCYRFKSDNEALNDLAFDKDQPCLFDSQFGSVLYNAWNSDQLVSLSLQELIGRPHCEGGVLKEYNPNQSEEYRFEISQIVLMKRPRSGIAPTPDWSNPSAEPVARRSPRVIKPRTPIESPTDRYRRPTKIKLPAPDYSAAVTPAPAPAREPESTTAPAVTTEIQNNNSTAALQPVQESQPAAIATPHQPLIVEPITDIPATPST